MAAEHSRVGGLEWQIAWRHLRADQTPRWVRRVMLAALYLLLVGGGLWLFVAYGMGRPTPVEGMPFPATDPVVDAGGTQLEQAFGLCAALSLGIGTVLLLFGLLARMFSVLATIVIFEVVLGSMAMVVVLSLMSGLEGDLRDKILAQRAHVRVSRVDGNRLDDYEVLADEIAATEGVAGASPYLDGEVMVRSGLNRNAAVLYGVVPERMAKASNLPGLIEVGSFEALTHPELVHDLDPLGYPRMSVSDITPVDDGGDGDEEGEEEIERALPAVDDPPGQGSEATEGAGADAASSEKTQKEAPERDTLDAEVADGGDGWEDPVEVLGLGAGTGGRDPALPGPAAVPTPSRFPTPPVFAPPGGVHDDGVDDEDGGWEDPVEVLDLDPLESPPDGDGDGVGDGDGDGTSGSDTSGEDQPEAVIDAILIGDELAEELTVGLGARTQLITPVGRMTPAGRIPGVLATRVGGIFHTGMYEYDSKSVYAPLPLVQKFLRAGDRVSGIEVRLVDQDDALGGKAAIEATVARLGRQDELVVETWMDLNRNLFSAMFLEKLAMFIALSFVVLVASFGILASNLMSVLEKSSEIAVLKAMGASDVFVQRVYWAEGLCVGIVGTTLGISLALVICWVLQAYGMPGLSGASYIEELPVTVNPLEVAAVAVVVMVIVWAFSLYPAYVASRMRPVDALRHAD